MAFVSEVKFWAKNPQFYWLLRFIEENLEQILEDGDLELQYMSAYL